MIERIVEIDGTFKDQPLSEQQLAENIEGQKQAKKEIENAQKKQAARQAILDRLGLSEEEARLLLG